MKNKISSSKLNNNYFGSMAYEGVLRFAISQMRDHLDGLGLNKDTDKRAIGTLYAISSLVEHNDKSRGSLDDLYYGEIKEWESKILNWLEQVEQYIPKKIRAQYIHNIKKCIQILLDSSNSLPKSYWKEDADERLLLINIKNKNVLIDYYNQAKEKHPVKLGNPLHKYIHHSLEKLRENGNSLSKQLPASTKSNIYPKNELDLKITIEEKKFYIYTDDFNYFKSPIQLENDIEITAYDIEEELKKKINFTKSTFFDCESSMFCLISSDLDDIQKVLNLLPTLKGFINI